MIEVYKTNILKKKQVKGIKKQIKNKFPNYCVDFDIEDCDHILRIETFNEALDNDVIINIVQELGFDIDILTDEIV
ncbi:hypothetical protein Q4603_18755 [Zobellia galactanivorans]|uniref:hypothetical protein n=1 Tax=Zobellia galactanivorans (strain DSM 12802 / CCUG 47099 / CIP 106680 / NCIMB 13871 / Dsij) TaxID=63186 RepID=UPI001C0794F6|nr:hypothetical protein [Zobellia galactanivorans]MBU3024741.1 hypothetical protein [Zobellia galactanivorans]MDO6810671.1 hypothetical protein [Zobellia galactanivorans]